MRAKDIHSAVEALLGERVGWSSVKMALASNVFWAITKVRAAHEGRGAEVLYGVPDGAA